MMAASITDDNDSFWTGSLRPRWCGGASYSMNTKTERPYLVRCVCCSSLPFRLSATVTSKIFPLYHFFPLFFPLFFHLPHRFPLNTPLYPTTTIKYHFLYQLLVFLSTNNYLWTHSIVFRVMNSDTLDLGGERRVPMRRGRCRGTAAAVGCPLQPACKGRGLRRGCRCAQP
jgi:hypothetical protein